MNAKLTPEDAADRLEAIARRQRAHDTVVDIASRVVIADRLEKASGLDALREFTPPEVTEDSQGALSGAAVLRALSEMCDNPPKAK
jgi:hypothetical protein